MFAKLLGFLSCLFLSCATDTNTGVKIVEAPHEPVVQAVAPKSVVEPIEPIKITPLPADYQPPQQEPVKSYNNLIISSGACATREEYNHTIGTGSQAMRVYKRANDCERNKSNSISMPKSVACEQPDGFHNMMLQFDLDFYDYFGTASNNGFYKIDNKLYYQIDQGLLAADGGPSFFYEYDCGVKKSKELKIFTSTHKAHIVHYQYIPGTLILGIQLYKKPENDGFNIVLYSGSLVSIMNLFPDGNYQETIPSSFSGYQIIQQEIIEYVNRSNTTEELKKYYNSSDFDLKSIGFFDIKNIKNNGKGKILVTIPGLLVGEFNIDIFRRKIW